MNNKTHCDIIERMNNKTNCDISEKLLDGAMGSLIFCRASEMGINISGIVPERLNFTQPQLIENIHRDYIAAGSDIILTNTFGANPIKYDDYAEMISAGIALAKKAAEGTNVLIAQDISSCGKIIGTDIGFNQVYESFKATIKAGEQADIIFIETITDIAELRAALIAAKENSNRRVMVSMSFESNLRTFFGCHISEYVQIADSLGADAIGINCSLDPTQLTQHVKLLRSGTAKPIFVKPNAGLPKIEDSVGTYDMPPEIFAKAMRELRECGADILGGCCGTTPQYIKMLKPLLNISAAKHVPNAAQKSQTIVIGERINPTGKPLLKAALKANDTDFCLDMAQQQIDAGADILDVNLGYNEICELDLMTTVINKFNLSVNVPICIDSCDAEVIERALRLNRGRAIVNSFNGKKESYTTILPLVKKYGAKVIGLCLNEKGIPETAAGRLEIARTLVEIAVSYGIKKEDIIIDTLTMAESTGRGNAIITLNTLAQVKKLGVKTVLGVSNISFGMPNRDDINAAFYFLARKAGLDYAIINPSLTKLTGSEAAFSFLSGAEGAAEVYIAKATAATAIAQEISTTPTLKNAIISGRAADSYNLALQLLQTIPGQQIIETEIIPALNAVGDAYEKGTSFLPQLIASAEAAKQAFIPINQQLNALKQSGEFTESAAKVKFVLATVEGDIHDIGKNIVKAVVSNYGYEVTDLGRDVKIAAVVAAVKQNYPCVLGLSALMTTTAVNMAKTIQAVRQVYPDIVVLVGGAVLTEQYANKIGGVYCKDANATLTQLKLIK